MKHIHHFQLIQPASSCPTDENSPYLDHSDPKRNIFLFRSEKMNENELQHVRSYDLVGVR